MARLCFVTCITHGYDAELKVPAAQTVPCDFIAYVEAPETSTRCGWTLVDVNKYSRGIDASDVDPHLVNSLANNQHSFNRAKFVKLNLHRLPELIDKYDVVVWLDGSVEITNGSCAEQCLGMADAGHGIVLFEHEFRQQLYAETCASNFYRYTSTFWNGQRQPFQDVFSQYQEYISQGFVDVGLWITCFVAFDMRRKESHAFLEEWNAQNLRYTTQDQIGFPFVCWKLGMRPHTLPDGFVAGQGHSVTDFYVKHDHAV